MNDKLYQYPESSCRCFDCDQHKYQLPTGLPSNMSVRGCQFSPYYDCNNKRVFQEVIEPQVKQGTVPLNPQVLTTSYDTSFQKFDCPNNQGDCKQVFASTDPRLISVQHGGQVLTLDIPPIVSNVKFENMYTDTSLSKYGQNYRTYSDINAGQYYYYVDKSTEDAFHKPLFSTSTKMVGKMYKDPMGAMKPQYDRIPLKKCDPFSSNTNFEGRLSWIQDSEEHRQDLLSRQMQKMNQTRFESRWIGLEKNE